MKVFRTVLLIQLCTLLVYTMIVGSNHGWNLFEIFFTEIAKVTWAGQFNLDFLIMLSLSAMWTAWRNEFSPKGLALSFIAFVGGTVFLIPYLLYLSIVEKGSVKQILIGKNTM